MAESENFGSFIKDNKGLVKEYLDTRLMIWKLKAIRLSSRLGGSLIWMLVSLFLVFLLMTFTGLVVGFWLSSLTGSYISGFGYTALIILAVILLLALFRKTLFINPVIRMLIRRAVDSTGETSNNKN